MVGGAQEENYQIAQQLRQQIAQIPGAVDVNVHQVVSVPSLLVEIDRTRADQLNLTEKQIADDLLVSLSGSGQTAPNFWLNPQNGVSYSISVQTPQYVIDSAADIYRTPISTTNGAEPQLLSNVAAIHKTATPVVVSHYNVQRVFDVYANVQNRDLGAVAQQVQKIVDQMKSHLPRGSTLAIRGHVESMNFLTSDWGLVSLLQYCWSISCSWLTFRAGSTRLSLLVRFLAHSPGSSGCCFSPVQPSACRR